MAKVVVSVKVEEAMKKKLEVIAKRMDLTLPDIVRQAHATAITAHEKAHGKISAEELNQLKLFDK